MSWPEVRLGLLSDVHGNRVALDAVVADGRAAGVDEWWVLGDLAAIGPEPAATLDALALLPGVRFVRGNTDRYVVTGARPPSPPSVRDEVDASFEWTRHALDRAGWLGWLADIPPAARATLPDGTRLVGVHASPSADDDAGITAALGDDDVVALGALAGADLVVGGHTHRPVDRRAGGVRAVNLGSVSNPITDDRRASYAIVDAGEARTGVELRRVAYDHAEVVDRIRRSGHPSAAYVASFQTGGPVRHPG